MANFAGALAGLRVLDLSTLLPGPFCSMLLADFGAEVIKVENPDGGDPYRGKSAPAHGQLELGFASLNRGKQSVAINLRDPEGRKAFLALVPSSDVLVEQFRPGVMARLGLDYDTLKAINPRLIYCSITGYGQTGPYAHLPGHDLNYIGLAGILGLMAEPIHPGTQIADLSGGSLMALSGILLALAERQQSGLGQHVDIGMLDGAVATLAAPMARYLATGNPPVPGGERLTGGWPNYAVYTTADDRQIALGALEAKFWRAFCQAVGREDWIPLSEAVGAPREQLRREVAALFRTRSLSQWLADLRAVDTCLTPVLRLEEVPQDLQVVHREMIVQGPVPGGGTRPMLGNPIKLSRTPARFETPAPGLGEQTATVLRAAGFTEAEITALLENGSVATN